MSKTSLQKSDNNIPFLRSAYDGFSDVVSAQTGLFCEDPTLAQQQFADEADINTIVNKFLRTGELPDETAKPRYGDFTGAVNNYHDALNLIIEADEAFMQLPAKIRARFNNDAGEYVEFFNNPDNRSEAEDLGLIEKRQESSSSSSTKHVEDDSSAAAAAQNLPLPKGGKKASTGDE